MPEQRVSDLCCLCAQPNDRTAEDAIPKWVNKLMAELHGQDGWITTFADGRQVTSSAPRRVRTWWVCEQCNAWMNQNFEIPFRPTVERLLRGERVDLDATQQRHVATWVYKTAIMLGMTRFSEEIHPPDYALQHLRKAGEPPAVAYVWIGTVTGGVPGSVITPPWRNVWFDFPIVTVPNKSWVTTFALLHLVGHVFIPDGIPRRTTGTLDTDYHQTMHRIWPRPVDVASWPPNRSLSEDDVYAYEQRFRFADRWGRAERRAFTRPLGKSHR